MWRTLRGTWMYRCVLVAAVTSLIIKEGGCASGFVLRVNTPYTVFTGRLGVFYQFPVNTDITRAYMDLVFLDANHHVIRNRPVTPHGTNTGHVYVDCGVVDRRGQYVFRLYRTPNGSLLTQSNVLEVVWPVLSLTLPGRHNASTKCKCLKLILKSHSNVVCNSVHPDSRFWIDVEYQGAIGANTSSAVVHRTFTAYTIQPSGIQLEKRTTVYKLPCDNIDQAGAYRALFKSNGDNGTIISRSNAMLVSWSKMYRLESSSVTVYPCSEYVTVKYRSPPCTGPNDKIRLFSHVRLAPGDATTDPKYLQEKRVRKSLNFVQFECALFSREPLRYCFEYVTVATSGAVQNQLELCLSTSANDTAVHGHWGSWSEWGSCTSRCGPGHQTRERFCNKPEPKFGGRRCPGDSVKWRKCNKPCPTTTPPSTTTAANVTSHLLSTVPVPKCACGCTLSEPQGEINATFPCPGNTTWVIRAKRGQGIVLNFELFDLEVNNQWVKVRDGRTGKADLLVSSTGRDKPFEVKSKGNFVSIHYSTSQGTYVTRKGFVVSYKTYNLPSTSVTSQDQSNESEESNLWKNTITVVGISLCAIIIFIAGVLVLRHRMQKKRRYGQYKLTNSTSNGQVPSVESTNSNQGITNMGTSTSNQHLPNRRPHNLEVGKDTPGVQQSLLQEGSDQAKTIETFNVSKTSSHNSLEEEGINMCEMPRSTEHHAKRPPSRSHSRGLKSPYNPQPSEYVHDPKLLHATPIPDKYSPSKKMYQSRRRSEEGRQSGESRDKEHSHRKHRHPRESPLVTEYDNHEHRRRKHHSKSPNRDLERHHRHTPSGEVGRHHSRSPIKEFERPRSPHKDVHRSPHKDVHKDVHNPHQDVHRRRSPTKELEKMRSPSKNIEKNYEDVYERRRHKVKSPVKEMREPSNVTRSKRESPVPKEFYKRHDRPPELPKERRTSTPLPEFDRHVRQNTQHGSKEQRRQHSKGEMQTISENLPLYECVKPRNIKHRSKLNTVESDSNYVICSAPNTPEKQNHYYTQPENRPLSPRPELSGISASDASPNNEHSLRKGSNVHSAPGKESRHSDKQPCRSKVKTTKVNMHSPMSVDSPNTSPGSKGPPVVNGGIHKMNPSSLTLPVRPMTRPDGRSPPQDVTIEDIKLQTPNGPPKKSPKKVPLAPSQSEEMKVKQQTPNGSPGKSPERFPVSPSRSCKTPTDFMSMDGYEYDDYIPNVPGSFFNMEDAYNANWTRQPINNSATTPKTSTPESKKYFEEKV